MEEKDKHDQPKAYTSFNTRFWIADKLKIIKSLKKTVFMVHLIYMACHGGNAILDSTEWRAKGCN